MASMIKGIPVTLYEKTVIGKDEFDRPLHQEIPVTIENVLVAPASTTEILNALNLTGKKSGIQYRNSERRQSHLAGLPGRFLRNVLASDWVSTTRH